MDLYIQIGVILILLTAFSVLLYLFTLPSENFYSGYVEETTTTSARVESLRESEPYPHIGKGSLTSGEEVLSIIESAKTTGLGVLVSNLEGYVSLFGMDIASRPNNSQSDYAQNLMDSAFTNFTPNNKCSRPKIGNRAVDGLLRKNATTSEESADLRNRVTTFNHLFKNIYSDGSQSKTFEAGGTGINSYGVNCPTYSSLVLDTAPYLTSFSDAIKEGTSTAFTKDLYLSNEPTLIDYYGLFSTGVSTKRNPQKNADYISYRILGKKLDTVGFLFILEGSSAQDFNSQLKLSYPSTASLMGIN